MFVKRREEGVGQWNEKYLPECSLKVTLIPTWGGAGVNRSEQQLERRTDCVLNRSGLNGWRGEWEKKKQTALTLEKAMDKGGVHNNVYRTG